MKELICEFIERIKMIKKIIKLENSEIEIKFDMRIE
jgi:hypothetical protein